MSSVQLFATHLAPHRDHLYALALARAGTPSRAEGLLQQTLRHAFTNFVQNPTPPTPAPSPDLLSTLESALLSPDTPAPVPPTPMPADTWARLYGALQLEAARLGPVTNLNPDSVLLSTDPLLAPKKHTPPDDFADIKLPPITSLFIAALAALVLGIALTIYFTTRTTPRPTSSPATPPATQPTTEPAPNSSQPSPF